MDSLTLRASRDAMIEVGRRIWVKGFAAANDGNLSIRLDRDRILATASGSIKGFLTETDLVVLDLDGNVIEGTKPATSEIKMHLAIYHAREDARAVAHAHPPTATGFATAGVELDLCVLPEIVATLGAIPTVPYATPSTTELPDALGSHIRDGHACLLANHGAVAWDEDLFAAYFHLERVEHFARILLTARLLGNVQVMNRDQVTRLTSAIGTDAIGPTCSPAEALRGAGTTSALPDSVPADRSEPDTALVESLAREIRNVLEDGG